MIPQALKFIVDSFLDFIFVYECEICHRHLDDKKMIICKDCFWKIDRTNPIDLERIFTARFGNQNFFISKAFSGFYFKEESIIQTLIHELKYQNKRSLGIFLGEVIGHLIKDALDFSTADILAPVPLHKIRLRERGYNQSQLIAKGVGRVIEIKVIEDLLVRARNTETQTKLNFEERKENVKDAFFVNGKYKNLVLGKRIIIVDDVITTGSTVNECAKALVQAGASEVLALSVAIAS